MSRPSEPSVCAVMLTKDRPEMARRAMRCFESQTYRKKSMVVVNTGVVPLFKERDCLREPCLIGADALTIGELRNAGNSETGANILIHWDDDDWSHPTRIAEQVELLQRSEAECVGYRDMLFWDSTEGQLCGAWRYKSQNPTYCLGTSLCYWRDVWEGRPFKALPLAPGGTGEDSEWLTGVKSIGFGSAIVFGGLTPLMIAAIHGSNSQDYHHIRRDSPNWQRAPMWDAWCRERMAL